MNGVGAGGRLAKAAARFEEPPVRPQSGRKAALKSLTAIWTVLLAGEGQRLAAAVKAGRTLKKAAGDPPEDPIDPIDPGAWDEAQKATAKATGELAQAGAAEGVAAIGLSDDGITALANPRAVAWAQAHAAELVSQVSATTEQDIRDLVAQSEEEGWSVDTLAAAIQDSTAFSAERAGRIALHETRVADNQGAQLGMLAAKELGVETEKNWQPRGDNVCPVCEANEADGWIAVDDEFTSGDDAPPAHVRCECDTEYRVKGDET
ncbi:MAG: phage minor head protein [Roseiarcus sp.]